MFRSFCGIFRRVLFMKLISYRRTSGVTFNVDKLDYFENQLTYPVTWPRILTESTWSHAHIYSERIVAQLLHKKSPSEYVKSAVNSMFKTHE